MKIFYSLVIIIIISYGIFYLRPKIINLQEPITASFANFIGSNSMDEYVVADLIAGEKFSRTEFNEFMGWLIGDTTAEISLTANYRYFVKLQELQHRAEAGVIYIKIPNLYLSAPVAFELSSVTETEVMKLLGPKGTSDNLKRDISSKLVEKGNLQKRMVYDKAAKALADNFNVYFKNNGFGEYYKSIVVTFSSEGSSSDRQFNYNESYCGAKPCRIELNLGNNLIFKID